MIIRELIRTLGGPGTVARSLGVSVKRVSMWGARNRVPGPFVPPVWRLAEANNVPWPPLDAPAARPTADADRATRRDEAA